MKTMYKFFKDVVDMCEKYNLNVGMVVGDVVSTMTIR